MTEVLTEVEKHIMMLSHEKQCFIDEGWNDNGEIAAYDYAIKSIEQLEKIQEIINARHYIEDGVVYSYAYDTEKKYKEICEVLDG